MTTELLSEIEVENIEVFEVLNNPIRLRILRQLVEPHSVRQIAETLDVPPTRLYYHVNLLEEVGAIRVVETRKVGAMIQKLYQVTARSFRPSPKLVEGDHEPEELARIATAVVLDGARLDSEAALTRHFETLSSGKEFTVGLKGSLGRTLGFFTKERAREFGEALEQLINEQFDSSEGNDGVEFAFSWVFFPVAGTDLGDEE